MKKQPYIVLPSGHVIDVLVDSVLGTDGQGYFLARILFSLLGRIRYSEHPVGSKTFTYAPRRGNFRWWFPFSTVLIWFVWGFGFFKLNRWGWTNEGIERWITERYPTLAETTQSPIANIGPFTVAEAIAMTERLNTLSLTAIIVSVGCHNAGVRTTAESVAIAKAVLEHSRHPVIIKLTYEQDYIEIAKALEGTDAIILASNTLRWSTVFPKRRKPFGQDWSVSGAPIRMFALKMIANMRAEGITLKIIGMGGITRYEHVKAFLAAGADAVAVATGYKESKVRRWIVRLVREYRESQKASAG